MYIRTSDDDEDEKFGRILVLNQFMWLLMKSLGRQLEILKLIFRALRRE